MEGKGVESRILYKICLFFGSEVEHSGDNGEE